jgi:peptide/nickel transport system permease protein
MREANSMTQPKAAPGATIGEPHSQELGTLSQRQLMSLKFRRHRLAVWSGFIVLGFYLMAAFCEFLAPYSLTDRHITHLYAPPQPVRFIGPDGLHLRPFVYGLKGVRHPQTLQKLYLEDRSQIYPLRFFAEGPPYRLWGLFETRIHLLGVDPGGTLFLLGTDSTGRDMLSRIAYGSRISLTIGLIGISLTFFVGLAVGAISGYAGGWLDNLIQRLIEILRSFPAIPLWMALAAALPATWSPLQVYFGITLLLSFVAWTDLARVVRGKILSLREEDYATAALLVGASRSRIILRHLLPGFASHIVVSLTLALPAMILAETALSFLGLGLRPPITSWGVLLQEAQNVQAVALHPWLLTPALFVILAVMAFNFVGDGLRDAADPYNVSSPHPRQ